MKKLIAYLVILVITLCTLSACNYVSYDEVYDKGYHAGYSAASDKHRSSPETAPTTSPSSSKADEILAKYGITEIRGSENTVSPTTSDQSTGSAEADAILEKYGVTQVRGSESTIPTSDGSEADKFIEKWTGGPTSYTPPVSGTILSGKEYYGSEITVKADGKSHYVVSLRNSSGIERMSFFVRAGHTVTVGVPSEYLYVYFASGNVWYGYGEGLMFGEDTVYSKDDDLLDFTNYTYEYTLYPVYNGNFSQTPCDESEFFK